MSLVTMRQELLGIPGTNFGLVTTKLNEAFAAVQDEQVWSFQLKTGGWLAPGMLGSPNSNFLSPGKITVKPYDTQIYADPVASQAWFSAALNPPLLTQQQIRVPYYSCYNIIGLGQGSMVSYLSVTNPGSLQTPGTYTVSAVNQAGDTTGYGAVAEITVNPDGTVTQQPVVLNPGLNYTAAPLFTLAAGGFPATFLAYLNAIITIDRPWMEPAQLNSGYLIYQCYFPAPPGFRRWHYFWDTTNNCYLDWWSYTQIDLSEFDAQRINFHQPTHVVAWGIDTRPGSVTLGQMLYELWPHPIMQLPYTFSCEALWPALQNPYDTLPYPLTDEIVKMRAYEMMYLWKESQKGNEVERGSGANWQFLAQAMRAEYQDRLKIIRVKDRNLVDLYFQKMRRMMPTGWMVFGTVTGQASVGGWDS